MPFFRRRASVIDSGGADETSPVEDRGSDGERVRALAEAAEAEAAEAEATAAEARARARALRLRREADAADSAPDAGAESGPADTDDALPEVSEENERGEPAGDAADSVEASAEDGVEDIVDYEDDTSEGDVGEDAAKAPTRRWWRPRLPRPTWKGIVAALTIMAIAALLVLSGLMIRQHRQAEQLRQLDAEYAAAARQSVVTLMSIDFNSAQEDVQRIVDNSTGQFHDDFETQAEDFVRVAKDSKVITEVTVNSTAVDAESMTDDSAVVLVAASSRVTNSAGANQEPRTWRLAVDLERDGGQLKMSKVEFVP